MARRLVLAQGWTASGTAQPLGRDPHTIGRWAAAFGQGGPAALIFEQSRGGGGPPSARRSGRRASGWPTGTGGGAPVCLGTVRHQPEPQRLPELSPSTRLTGVCIGFHVGAWRVTSRSDLGSGQGSGSSHTRLQNRPRCSNHLSQAMPYRITLTVRPGFSRLLR